jgi:ClpP class serine protease
MSGGTLIALAADEIVMAPSAVLGPVEPEIGELPAVSILAAASAKEPKDADDETLIMADIAAKAIGQLRDLVAGLARRRLPAERADELARRLTEGRWTHDFPISAELAASLGLTVSTDLPTEVRRLMELYRAAWGRRPSVQYVPIPYGPPSPKPAVKRRQPATPGRAAHRRQR